MKRVLAPSAVAVVIAAAIWFFMPSDQPPCIVLFSVDTLRADRLGCYGNDSWSESPSPVADRLAAQGILLENFTAPRGQTHPSIASMLLGKYPITHGLRENGQKPRPGHASFVEHLAGEGYATAGFVANMQAYTLRTPRRPAWWTRGFDTFGDGYGGDPIGAVRRPLQDQWGWDGRVEKQAVAWIRSRADKKGEPFFLWVHLFDVHKPFLPHATSPDFTPGYEGPLALPHRDLDRADPERFDTVTPAIDRATLTGESLAREDREYVLACYDAGVAGADARIGRILAELGAAGLMDDTWVIYTSDHGEELGDHNEYYYHGASIYETVLKLPCVIRPPRGETSISGLRTAALSQNVDLAPTLLELAGIEPPDGMEGFSLAAVLSGEAQATERTLIVAEWQDLIYSVSDGTMKYIFNPQGACPLKPPWGYALGSAAAKGFVYEREELYDLSRDPLEQNNLAADRKGVVSGMRKKLDEWLSDPVRQQKYGSGNPMTDEEKALIEALGYTAPDRSRRDVRFR